MQLKFVGLICLFATACNSQPAKNSAVNLREKGFKLDVSFFADDNNIAKAVVAVDGGYIIAGQKFTKLDSVTQPSAIVMISTEGKLLKKEFLGNNGGFDKTARIENVIQVDHDKIVQVGQKLNKLWLRQLDVEMNTVRDTVIQSVPFDVLYGPKFGLTIDQLYIVSNPFAITILDKAFGNIDYTDLNKISESFGISSFTMFDAALHQKTGLFYIIGNGCVDKKKDSCALYKELLMVYDTKAKTIVKTMPLPEFSRVKCIRIHEDQIFISGERINKLDDPSLKKYYISNNFDFVVSSYDLQGKKMKQFTFDETEHEFINDMMVEKGRIYLAGELFDKASISFKSLYVVFDLKGNVVEKRIFGYPSVENRLTKIYVTGDGKKLLLGKGRGWRIVLVD